MRASQLYVPEMTRSYLKSEINSYVNVYLDKLLPVFIDIEADADRLANKFYEDFMNSPADDDMVDMAAIPDKALEIGINHYSYLKLGKYNLTAIWHATLYQIWEQQLRSFLFREMSHTFKIEFNEFCNNFKEIKEAFLFHKVEIVKFTCWNKIRELKLLSNVIKHGDGASAKSLRKVKPSIFKNDSDINYIDLYKTTLLKETLNVNEETMADYRDALLKCWDEIPERNYSEAL